MDIAFVTMEPPPTPDEVKYMHECVKEREEDAKCPAEIAACVNLFESKNDETKLYM